MAIDPDLTQLRKKIKALLAERRPDRYTVRGAQEDTEDTGADWLDEIAEEIADEVPDEHAKKLYARKLVGQAEGQATTSANALLRKIARDGQLVLDWFEYADLPIAVSWEEIRDDRLTVKEERVALRAAGPDDFERWEVVERRRAGADFAARNAACDGAQLVARLMRAGGFRRFDGWAGADA